MQNYIAARLMATLHVLKTRYSERGASALEYVGMVILAGLIVAAIAAAINPGDITSKVSSAVTKIFQGQ